MRVLEIMTGTPYRCRPECNLGAATELMWIGNCGFLPVVTEDAKVVGVITDRDICVALGTRGQPAGEVAVAEVMSRNVYFCAPEDDVRTALRTMCEARVRRLPVVAQDGTLVGVLSIDEVLQRAELRQLGRVPEISSDEVIRTLQSINAHQLPPPVAAQRAAA